MYCNGLHGSHFSSESSGPKAFLELISALQVEKRSSILIGKNQSIRQGAKNLGPSSGKEVLAASYNVYQSSIY